MSPDPPSRDDEAEASAGPLDVRRLMFRLVLGLALLLAVLVAASYLFREELVGSSRWFVQHLGGPGIAVGFMIPDAFTVPLPQDALLVFGLVGGMSFWIVVAWGTGGSLAGGSLGFVLGRQLRRTRWYKRFVHRRGFETEQLVRRYGSAALAIGAVTPLPYSVLCWTSGALGMRFGPFLAISLLRVLRVAGYLWLIELGFFHVLPQDGF